MKINFNIFIFKTFLLQVDGRPLDDDKFFLWFILKEDRPLGQLFVRRHILDKI